MNQPTVPVAPLAPVPERILDCLAAHHVAALAVSDANGLWAASCFYAFDAATMDLIVLTSTQTRHGRAMLTRAAVAGTVAGQPESVTEIRGVQFAARAFELSGGAARAALDLYSRRHPLARLARAALWRLRLDVVKLTENRFVFAQKTHWARGGGDGADGV